MNILKALQKVSMTLEILKETKVGVTVNKCKKKYKTHSIASDVCKNLIVEWKKLTESSSADPPSTSTNKAAIKTSISPTETTRSNRLIKAPSRLINEQQSNLTDTQQVKAIKISSSSITMRPNQSLPTRNASTGELTFPDYPHFHPNLTPKEVLQVSNFVINST